MIERIEINLLPREYRDNKRPVKIPRTLVYPIVLLIVGAVIAAWYTMYLRDEEARIIDESAKIAKEIEDNRHVSAEINQMREVNAVTDQKIKALERISVDREKWVRLLEVLSRNLPAYTWLVSVREEAGPARLNIEARTFSFPDVAHYMTKLEDSEYVKSVELRGIERVAGAGRETYRFNIVAMLSGDDAPVIAEAAAGESAAAETGRARRGGR